MKIAEWFRNVAQTLRGRPHAPAPWIPRTDGGVYVDQLAALQNATYWACVLLISSTIGALPWQVYTKRQQGRRLIREITERDESWLLNVQANPDMTAVTYRETCAFHLLVHGNAYAEIERTADGRPQWLWPIEPDRVRIDRNSLGELVYRVRNDTRGEVVVLAEDMLHYRGLGVDGVLGMSPLQMAAQSLGHSIALDKFGARFFGNGANPGSVLEHPGQLDPQAHANLKKSVEDATSGANALKVLILEEGMKFKPLAIPPEEAQFLESRKFQVAEICRWFRVPPHMVGDLDKATFSNIEQQSIEFVTYTLMPWIKRLEAETDIKLFGRQNRGRVYTKLNVNALLRGDFKSRVDAYHAAIADGWLNRNEVRELEERNAVDGLDDYLVPLNLAPADLARQLAERRAEPAPAPAAPEPDADDEDTKDPPLRVVPGGK